MASASSFMMLLIGLILYVKKLGNTEYIAKFEGVKEALKIALNDKAWDGEWFKRAYMDDR
ncbi:MAG: hypothetical protein HFJ51_04185 [Clostridia bacterium]|nr:hypothetical protein [Clostridia bacterium]